MKQYIVLFAHNKPLAAYQLDTDQERIKEFLRKPDIDSVEWLVVFGNDNKDAIRTARQLAKNDDFFH